MQRQVLLLVFLSVIYASSLPGQSLNNSENLDNANVVLPSIIDRRKINIDFFKEAFKRITQSVIDTNSSNSYIPFVNNPRQPTGTATGGGGGGTGATGGGTGGTGGGAGGAGGGGGNNVFSYSGFFSTIGITYTAAAVIKAGFITLLTLVKAFVIPVGLATALLIAVAGGSAFFVCAITNCYGRLGGGAGLRPAGGGNTDGSSIDTRNAIDYLEEFLSIFQGIEEEGYRNYETQLEKLDTEISEKPLKNN